MIILKTIILAINYIVFCRRPDESFFNCLLVFCLGTFCDYVPLAYMINKKGKNGKGIFMVIIGFIGVAISLLYSFAGLIGAKGDFVIIYNTHMLETSEDFWAWHMNVKFENFVNFMGGSFFVLQWLQFFNRGNLYKKDMLIKASDEAASTKIQL